MKKENRKNDDPNCIEEEVRKIFGYDEESLLAEMDEAERAWEAEKAANPDAAASAQRQADEGFEQLMAKIREKGIQPVSEDEYKAAEENDRVVLHEVQPKRRKKKMLLLVAAVFVLGLGTTMVVSARREYKYSSYPLQSTRNSLFKQNVVMKKESGKLEKAYDEIAETLNIKVMTLAHIPENMTFEKMIINDNCAIIEFLYDGKSIYLREKQYADSKEVIEIITSDRKTCETVYNKWLGETILIEENKLDDDSIEYSAYVDKDNSLYYLSGVMKKNKFIEIVEGLCYQ